MTSYNFHQEFYYLIGKKRRHSQDKWAVWTIVTRSEVRTEQYLVEKKFLQWAIETTDSLTPPYSKWTLDLDGEEDWWTVD
ncbi:hypothetical protein DUI87_09322 [Hirundo rustica rustica]|uniref:Uncharacterized protein n=1 Tax=Hirundo rustica rustica TaxID=333673 RepID=A0A3M0KNN0_HIRRU|nr:hypothetical protein DUI87_09322 [Hirundo rustica rustica]